MPITNIKIILAAALSTAIILVISFLLYSNHSLKKELKITNEILVQAQVANNAYRDSVERQNSAIDNLVKVAEENQKKHSQALAKAKTNARKASEDSTQILLMKKPQGVSSCDFALDIIKKELANDE